MYLTAFIKLFLTPQSNDLYEPLLTMVARFVSMPFVSDNEIEVLGIHFLECFLIFIIHHNTQNDHTA